MTNYVLYHGPSCADGFGAAWAYWYSKGNEKNTKYVSVVYGEKAPEQILQKDANVFILDFCYPREVLYQIYESVNKLVVIDHHKSNQEKLEGITEFDTVFELTSSGAVLAWEYFNKNEQVPVLLRYVEDRDLWNWNIDGSKEVNAALSSYPFDFEVWYDLAFERPIKELVFEGARILAYKQKVVEAHVRNAFISSKFEGLKVPTCNASTLQSEIGHELLQKYSDAPFVSSYYDDGSFRHWSLRSEDSRMDVSEVAKQRGGGGHRNAAGFEEPRPKSESL